MIIAALALILMYSDRDLTDEELQDRIGRALFEAGITEQIETPKPKPSKNYPLGRIGTEPLPSEQAPRLQLPAQYRREETGERPAAKPIQKNRKSLRAEKAKKRSRKRNK